MSNDELAIRNLIDTWCRATETGDVDALAPLMADDMVFLTPAREPFGNREILEGSRQSAGKVSVQADVKEVRVAGDPRLLLAEARGAGDPVGRRRADAALRPHDRNLPAGERTVGTGEGRESRRE